MKKITLFFICALFVLTAKAINISPDPLTLSNWETGTTTNPSWTWNNPYNIVNDPNNSSNKVLKLDRLATNPVYNGVQWNNGAFTAGVPLGLTSASQYRYIVVRAKKSTDFDMKVKLESPVNATQNLITLTSINASVSGQWVTYIFDAGIVNNTHKLFTIMPEFGGNTGVVTTYIDDVYFTNTLPTVTFTTYKFPLTYTTGTSGGTVIKTYDIARSATNIDITLLNTQPIPGATSYNVYDGATKLTSTYDATKNVIKITGLSRSTNYNLQITGVDASSSESVKSEIIQVSTRSNTGSGYEVIDDGEGGALGWNTNSGGGASITQNVNNPVTNGINPSSKCIKLNTQSGSNYYTNAAINNERVLSGASNANYRYLHIKILRPNNSNVTGGVSIKLFNGGGQVGIVAQEIATISTVYKDDAWHDYVFDLGSGTATVESFYRGLFIMPNKLASGNQPAVLDYYIDDIYLSNDATLSTANLSTVNIPLSLTSSTTPSGTGGTIFGNRGYLTGDGATVSAISNSNYRFVNWTLNNSSGTVQSTSPSYTSTITSATTLCANFIQTWTYTATSSDVTKGTVSGTGVYDNGSPVSLSAAPNTGYRFVDWRDGSATGNQVSTNATFQFTSGTSHKNYFANFIQQYSVALSAGTGGSITSGAGIYDTGASATVIAAPSPGYRFVNWTLNTSGGAEQSTSASYTFTVSSNKTLVANFIQQYSVATSAGTGGSITSGAGTYDTGASATVIAAADAGYHFVNWTESNVEVSQNASYSFTVSSAHTLVANFAINTYAIGASSADVNAGSVSGGATYNYGTTASLTATPSTGYHFVNWTESGSEISQNASYGFTVSSARTLVANFASNTQSISGAVNADITALNNCSQCDVTVQQGATFGVNVNKTFNSLTVSPGGQLNLSSGKSLTTSSFVLQSNDTLTATYLDNGGTLSATTATVQQYLTGGRNWYISSPVSNASSAVFNPAGGSNKIYWYDEAHGTSAPWSQIFVNDSLLRAMKGYVVNMATDGAVSFPGTLNTGGLTISLSRTAGQTKEGFNLVGNPYPSYLNWDQVTKNNLESPSMWQRTKNGAGTYVFDTYNSAGQMATNNSGKRINGHIPPMQAFWVRVATGHATGSITVDNTMRAHKNTQMIGTGSTVVDPAFKAKSITNQVQEVLRVQVSNGANSDETILYTNSGATNGYDIYDSQKMFSNSGAVAEIYTLENNEPLAINGYNTIPFDTEIPLGFNTTSAGNFSLKVSQFSNFDPGTQVLLKDYLNPISPVTTNLSDGSSYSFISDVVSNNTSRFSLIFHAPSVATGINTSDNNSAFITCHNGQIMLNGISNNSLLDVFNATGQKIISKNLTESNLVVNNYLASGVYLVKVTSAGRSLTKKIIID